MTAFRRSIPFTGLTLLAMLAGGCVAARHSVPAVLPAEIVLDARRLHEGLESSKTWLDEKRNVLEPDTRAFRFGGEQQGVIVTDIVDLGSQNGLIGQETEIRSVRIALAGFVPDDTAIETQVRTGNRYFDQSDWNPWTPLTGFEDVVTNPADRYIQARLMLKAASPNRLPHIASLTFAPQGHVPDGPRRQQIRVADAVIQNIVRSPVEFHYERPDHPKMTRFRETAKLNTVVVGARDDFDTLVKLMDWIGRCANVRDQTRHLKGDSFTWDIDGVFDMHDGKPYIYGKGMSYATVLISAATSLGYVGARHMALPGFRDTAHDIVEIWVPSLGKWVHFDPFLSVYYFDRNSGQPLNSLEIHRIVSDHFLPNGQDMRWWTALNSKEKRAHVRKAGGTMPFGFRSGPSHRGPSMDPKSDWDWMDGCLAAGFPQMTPRNDFHSQPEKNSRHFGHTPDHDSYHFWVDDKTPPTQVGHNWRTRPRDFYWTLDQASFRLVRSADGGTLFVEFGNSMPHFNRYLLKIDGNHIEQVGSNYEWRLKAGFNTLQVVPEDLFGKIGQGSSIAIHCRI